LKDTDSRPWAGKSTRKPDRGPPDVASRDTNVAIVVREPIALLSEGKKLGLK
jgi:hypothetical protein